MALPWRLAPARLGLVLALFSGSPDRALAIDCGEVVTFALSAAG